MSSVYEVTPEIYPELETPELIDGFHLLLDALKLNGIDTTAPQLKQTMCFTAKQVKRRLYPRMKNTPEHRWPRPWFQGQRRYSCIVSLT